MKPNILAYLGISCMSFYVMHSCTANQIVGGVKDSIFFSQKLEDTIAIDFFNNEPEEVRVCIFGYDANYNVHNELIQELTDRKISIFNSHKEPKYRLIVKNYYYDETPSTDSYIDDYGNSQTMQTTDYHFKIKGELTNLITNESVRFSGESAANSRVGKSILGFYTEKGVESCSRMSDTGIYRFAGRLVKNIQKWEHGEQPESEAYEDDDVALNGQYDSLRVLHDYDPDMPIDSIMYEKLGPLDTLIEGF